LLLKLNKNHLVNHPNGLLSVSHCWHKICLVEGYSILL